MIRIIVFFILIALNLPEMYAQQPLTDNIWKTLSKISYKKEYDELMGFKIDKPVFSESVKALEGKEVTIKGYIIPVEGYKSHKEFIFSAFPYSMCFFCGGAGPETVMEVEATEGIKVLCGCHYHQGYHESSMTRISTD
jgi:hypothetical protein